MPLSGGKPPFNVQRSHCGGASIYSCSGTFRLVNGGAAYLRSVVDVHDRLILNLGKVVDMDPEAIGVLREFRDRTAKMHGVFALVAVPEVVVKQLRLHDQFTSFQMFNNETEALCRTAFR